MIFFHLTGKENHFCYLGGQQCHFIKNSRGLVGLGWDPELERRNPRGRTAKGVGGVGPWGEGGAIDGAAARENPSPP